MLDLTVLSDSNPTNIIRSVLRNAADTIPINFGGHSNEIKEPTSGGIKEPNIDGTNKTAHKCYKSYKCF